MKLLTIGDFYRQRFGNLAEMLITFGIVISYLGWVSAQISALGLVFHVVSFGEISKIAGMWIGSCSILIYTWFGGMWAVAITDFIQMIVIIVGMLYIGSEISTQAGGVGAVVAHASQSGKFNFWPPLDLREIISFFTAWITMMLGSIPQQDVFQRVQSSRTVNIAIWAAVLGGCLYFLFAFVPMFLVYAATIIDPVMVASLIDTDPQMILPTFVLQSVPLIAQIVFFGALLSAIKSCASATLLAPSVIFAENIVKPTRPGMTDRMLLRTMRLVTLVFTVLVTLYASNTSSSIFKMVENAYQVTLVIAFVPLVCGIYWQRANNQGAVFSIFFGLAVWVGAYVLASPEPLIPAQLAGVLSSAFGMVLGSLMPNLKVVKFWLIKQNRV